MRTPLERWLAGATRGLSLESVAKVRAEIEEHYGSAIAHGATNEDAVAALGDAKTANRQYKKVLLTAYEAKLLQKMTADFATRYPRPKLWWMVRSVLLLILGGSLIVSLNDPWWLCFVATLVGWAFLELFLPIRTRSQGLVLRCLRWGVLFAIALLGGNLGNASGAFLLMLLDDYHRMGLRRKLPMKRWPKELYL